MLYVGREPLMLLVLCGGCNTRTSDRDIQDVALGRWQAYENVVTN